MKRFIGLVALALLLGGALLFVSLYWRSAADTPRVVTIAPGNAGSITDTLMRNGVVRSRLLFRVALRVMGKENELHSGIYEIPPHASNREIIMLLSRADAAKHHQITIPEGSPSWTVAHLLTAAGCDSTKFMAAVHDSALAARLGVPASTLEGWLFPETYVFDGKLAEREMATRMVRVTQQFLTDSLRARAAERGWTVEQLLAFASIVEGEAAVDSERARIAGVYMNRLRRGMRMEADPTIQYIVGSSRRLTYDDLKIESPYNTYLHTGLPPTPINNPGRASIRAALDPESNDYFYFVARGDGTGRHRFARTLEEHEKNVAMYRRTRE